MSFIIGKWNIHEFDFQKVSSKIDRSTPVDIFHISLNTDKILSDTAIALFSIFVLIKTPNEAMELGGTKGMQSLFETVHFSGLVIVFIAFSQFLVLLTVSALSDLAMLLWL